MNNNVISLMRRSIYCKNDTNEKNKESIYDEDEIYNQSKMCQLHIKEEIIENQIINSDNVANRTGVAKLVTFESIEQVDQYEKQHCENQNSMNSWKTCKEKFKTFPCKIYCRFTNQGLLEGYSAQYLTIEEYIQELCKGLRQAGVAI